MATIRFRRKNTAWLTVLGLVLAFALLAGSVTLPVQLTLIGLFLAAMLVSMLEFGQERESLMDTLRRAPIRQRMSPTAREAAERAVGHGGYISSGITLMDVGVVAAQSSIEGLSMRRTRAVSKDDDGVRPFVTLNVEPEDADRHALVRFEILDQQGEQVYVHEMKAFLRDGEMSIMADHHLPLAGNSMIDGTGEWDLRVFMDQNLVGIHNFTMSPSITERSRRLSGLSTYELTVEEEFDLIDEVKQDVPPSLQDLLQKGSTRSAGTVPIQANRSAARTEPSERRVTTTTRRRR